MAEVLHLDHSAETWHTTVPFSTYSIFFLVVEWEGVSMCVGYEAVMAALRLSLCSAGSEVTAAWNSALWFWANFCMSATEMFWLSVEEKQTELEVNTGDRSLQKNEILMSTVQDAKKHQMWSSESRGFIRGNFYMQSAILQKSSPLSTSLLPRTWLEAATMGFIKFTTWKK